MKKWFYRITATALSILLLLVAVIVKPNLTYAHQTTFGNSTVFHNKPLEPLLKAALDDATAQLKKSELYTPTLKLEICLSDGLLPRLMRAITGPAFGWGFYNKVVLRGNMDCGADFIELEMGGLSGIYSPSKCKPEQSFPKYRPSDFD